ncbi:hypothetical protein ABT354_08270 [Streptomyces sp. NPDC000594]|uniref:hypothetical protein n=1 Tax=Streptomyces sp. NPDC000594 TaxID=3154261 RepID=UPI0033270789
MSRRTTPPTPLADTGLPGRPGGGSWDPGLARTARTCPTGPTAVRPEARRPRTGDHRVMPGCAPAHHRPVATAGGTRALRGGGRR